MGRGGVEKVNGQVTEWAVGGSTINPTASKIPYIPSQRITDKMTDDQKRGVQMWNMMRQALLDNGLMETK